MFAFGSNGSKEPEDSRQKATPPAADWTQLVQNDQNKASSQSVVSSEVSSEASPYHRCNEIASRLEDPGAKDLLKALVFLTSRSNKR